MQKGKMKIGIFDSGLGGLLIAKAVRKLMPEYDYVYLGDTKRVPYGNRSFETVYEFTKEGVEYLLKKENCGIVILACNTASARALKRIQKEYLPKNFPDRKVLGVLIPLAEECAQYDNVGVLATLGTVSSQSFVKEIRKLNKKTIVSQNAAPMLVPLAEEGEVNLAREFIKKYLQPFKNKKLEALALGCTHYPLFKKEIRQLSGVKVLSQDEIIPKKLKAYFKTHQSIEKNLSRNRSAKILVTDKTQSVDKLTKKWFGSDIKPKLIQL